MEKKDLWTRRFGAAGAGFALLAVALGAFGAHGLEGRLTPADLATFETAVRYQMYHALGLLALAGISLNNPEFRARMVGWAFLLGIVIFSGSLYLLVFSGIRWLGAITPLGGLAFLVGWSAFAWNFLRRNHV